MKMLMNRLSRFENWYILQERRIGESIVKSNNQIDIVPSRTVSGTLGSVITGGRIVEVASSDKAFLENFNWERFDKKSGYKIDEQDAEFELEIAEQKSYYEMPVKERVEIINDIWHKINSQSEKIAFLKVALTHNRLVQQFVSTKKRLRQVIPRTGIIFSAIFYDKGKQKMIFGGVEAQGGIEVTEKLEYVNRIADGERLLEAIRVEPGSYEAIFTPEFSGIFAHEAFGHGTEADLFEKGRSMATNYLGKKVASELVNLYDSPSLSKAAASFLFDDEGMIASATKIIDNGILIGALSNLDGWLHNDIKRTANGRRENLFHKAYARMTNTYFEKGESKLTDMISSIENGLMLCYPTNGMEDPKGWGIQLEGLAAKEIKGGRLTGRIFSPVIVSGFVPDLLKSVSMVSDKVEIDGLGYCGKGKKEIVKVTDGGPYLKLIASVA